MNYHNDRQLNVDESMLFEAIELNDREMIDYCLAQGVDVRMYLPCLARNIRTSRN